MSAPNTFYRVVCQAMRNAGLLGKGQEPSSEDLATYLAVMNDILNYEQTQGLKLWLELDLPITLVAGQNLYTIAPGGTVSMTKPLKVTYGYYLDVNNISRPLIPLATADWVTLSTKTSQGAINSYYVKKLATSLQVYFWLTPDTTAATGTAHVIIQQQQVNVVAVTDTMVLPQEWFIWAHWALADEICTGQPESIMTRCTQRAQYYRTQLENWDVEDAPMFIQADSRTGYISRFNR
jgi:hypothetical protein